MTLYSINEVKGALISKLKATTSIVSRLANSDEIRELSWKGTNFSYPNIRVKVNSLRTFQDCYQELEASIYVSSELDSSIEADEIAGIIVNTFHTKNFTSDGIRFNFVIANPIPAFAPNQILWRSEIVITTNIQ